MLKKTYKSLELLLEDLKDNVIETNLTARRGITTEFVRLNEESLPFLTGTTKRNIITNTNYREGRVINTTPYAVVRYYDNKTGKIKYFEYTWDKYKEELSGKWIDVIEKKL
jgi:hypothetical protein